MSNKYLAISIGPIFNTLQLARKTRELWSVSFTFSILMKNLINEFKTVAELISPSITVLQPLHGAGVFPDRCYFKLKENFINEGEIDKIKSKALDKFSGETGINEGLDYYQIYILQKEIDKNPIGVLNVLLDGIELQQKYSNKALLNWDKYWNNDDKTISKDFFQDLYAKGFDSNDDLLPLLVVDKAEKIKRFMSIPEISTNELAKKHKEKYWATLGYQGIETSKGTLQFTNLQAHPLDDEDKIMTALKEAFKDEFLFRHKYFSIVYADGDNVGALIKAIENNKGTLSDFSEAINSFVTEAAESLVQYGAFPIYMGGDDLLFFAPMANDNIDDNFIYRASKTAHGNLFGKNLLFLLSKLNAIFQGCLKDVTDKFEDLPAVTLSFGVLSGYYKQPMKEILTDAYKLLVDDAKKQPSKNYVSMKVQKHSGNSFEFGFKQDEALYEHFLCLTVKSKEKDENYLNSVMYKLDDQKLIIGMIGLDKAKLKLFFEENYNENIHDNYGDFFGTLVLLINAVFENFKHLELNKKMDKIYGALRFVQFLNAKDIHE